MKLSEIEKEAIENINNQIANGYIDLTDGYQDTIEFSIVKNALKQYLEENTCLHCGKGKPAYCEDCYQELIAKNAELQHVIHGQECVIETQAHNEEVLMEYLNKPKLIKTWEELFALPPNDKYKIVPDEDGDCCGWIVPIKETPETEGRDYFDHHIYLSTHTFYGNHYEVSTKILQEFGFNVEIDNWDKEISNMEECYICKELKEKGNYQYSKNYTTIAIEKGDNGKYRCFAWGEGEASISCNYCPHCGRQLEELWEK